MPPLDTAVVTVGAIHAGQAPNVIPAEAELRVTVRAFKPQVRDLLQQRITEIAQTRAAVCGAQADVDCQRRYPVLVNDDTGATYWAKLVEACLPAARAGSGAHAELESKP